jgi:hypothetical protein
MRRAIVAAVCAAPLVGCGLFGGGTPPNELGPFPQNYKAIVAGYIKEHFYEPYSLRDVAIGQPRKGQVRLVVGWVVCVQANGRTRLGTYGGVTRSAFLIRDGSVSDMFEGAPACDDQPLQPWPEMESAGASIQ